MNIFALDENPGVCARRLHDKHVVKMVLESTQMLCTAFHVLAAEDDRLWSHVPYKPTHQNHRCNCWVRLSSANFCWLLAHALELCEEYRRRFGKVHKCTSVLNWVELHDHHLVFRDGSRIDPQLPHTPVELQLYFKKHTPFAQATGSYQSIHPTSAYRQYYMHEKLSPLVSRFRNIESALYWASYSGKFNLRELLHESLHHEL